MARRHPPDEPEPSEDEQRAAYVDKWATRLIELAERYDEPPWSRHAAEAQALRFWNAHQETEAGMAMRAAGIEPPPPDPNNGPRFFDRWTGDELEWRTNPKTGGFEVWVDDPDASPARPTRQHPKPRSTSK